MSGTGDGGRDVQAALVTERLALCGFLGSLDEADWIAPSRCAGWSVHAVVAHLTLSTRTSTVDFVKGMLRHRGDFDEMNAVDARKRAAEFTPAQLVDQLEQDADSTKKAFGSSHADGLTDVIVHGQDIARALGRPHAANPGRVELALDHVVTSRWYPAKKALGNTTMTATDSDWSHGAGGVTLSGLAIDLLLAGTGRLDAVDHLTGTGIEQLREQLAK